MWPMPPTTALVTIDAMDVQVHETLTVYAVAHMPSLCKMDDAYDRRIGQGQIDPLL